MLEKLERRTKFMSREVVTLRDTLWRLTKRVTALESFIVKQFGNSKKVLDIDEHDLEDLLELSCARKGPIRGMERSRDSEDEDATYSPRKTPASKRKARVPNRIQTSATRYGRIPKLRTDVEVDFNSSSDGLGEPLDQLDEDLNDNEENTVLSVLNSCEVNMLESGNEVDVKPNKLAIDMNEDDEEGSEHIEKYTCPECSSIFAGRAFLNFHMKKVHPNVRIIIQPPKPISTPPSKKVTTQGCQTKEERADKLIPAEVASKIVKYSVRAGTNFKQLTLNGYNFSRCKINGNLTYWRCKQGKLCSGTIIENEADGTYRRGTMGWAADGLTHITHPPNFAKIEIALKRGRAIDLGQDWDRKKKCARKHPPKKRVMKGMHILQNRSLEQQIPASSGSPYSSNNSTAATGVANAGIASHQPEQSRDQSSGNTSGLGSSTYGIPYVLPGGYTMPPIPVSHNSSSSNFGHYGNLIP